MNQLQFDPHAASNAETCPDLLRCMYNLSDLDMEILRHLLKEGPCRSEDLADVLGRDRSTVYRSLQKLVSCQVATKETKSLDRGGYYHVYGAVPKDVLRERLEHCIEEWHVRVSTLLDRFDEDLETF
jgi:predicted transcriptional regulator